jgi:acetyl esterase/lipase
MALKHPAALVVLLCAACSNAPPPPGRELPPPQVVHLWPAQPPGTESWTGAEQALDAVLPNLGRVHVITNVTIPTLTIFRPAAGKENGTAILVVPGGAFRALPWDLDGTETARWLTARGITAFVLKYRVRPPANGPADANFEDFARRTQGARDIAVADAEQAVRLIRSGSKQFAIAPARIGMIGFSAGAMTAMSVAFAADPSVRPDFAVVLYGALLTKGAPPRGAPPLFIVAAQDDPQVPAARSVEIFDRWSAAGLPAELHLYERGGHGFGFRPHHLPSDRWPSALEAWLAAHGELRSATQRGAGSR